MGVRDNHASTKRKKNRSSGYGYCFTDGRVISVEIVAMCQSFFSHVAICIKGYGSGRNKAKILTRGPIGSAPAAE
jgi:hypothetical protein